MCCPPWSPAAVTQVSCLLLSVLPRPRQAELQVYNIPNAASALAFEFQRQSRGRESLAEIKTRQFGEVPAILRGATVGWWWWSAAWPAKLLLAVSAALRVMQKSTGSGSFLHYLYFWMFAGCTRSCVFCLESLRTVPPALHGRAEGGFCVVTEHCCLLVARRLLSARRLHLASLPPGNPAA